MPNKLHCNGCLKGPLRGVDAVVSVMTVRRKRLIQITDCAGWSAVPGEVKACVKLVAVHNASLRR